MRPLNLIAGWGIFVLTGFALLSLLFSPFVPSPLMVEITVWSAIFVGVFYGVFFWGVGGFGWTADTKIAVSGSKPSKFLTKRYLRGPFMGLVFFFFTWVGLGSGAPWLVTIVAGHNGAMTAIVDGWAPGSHRTCFRPTLQHVPPFMMGHRALCIDENRKVDMPPGTTLRILGKVSILGVSATRIEWSPQKLLQASRARLQPMRSPVVLVSRSAAL